MATHKTYQSFAKNLLQLLDSDSAVRLTVPSFMPLSIEDIGKSGDGNRLVSLCHYGEQNGDLMRDPDIVFMFHELPDGLAAEPVSPALPLSAHATPALVPMAHPTPRMKASVPTRPIRAVAVFVTPTTVSGLGLSSAEMAAISNECSNCCGLSAPTSRS